MNIITKTQKISGNWLCHERNYGKGNEINIVTVREIN